jgi:hypothetical protein
MKDFQLSSKEELQRIFEERSFWTRIHENKLLCKKQSERAAHILTDGLSQILTYYDEHLNYLCTMHKVVSSDGRIVVHEHIKDCVLDGVRYRIKDNDD